MGKKTLWIASFGLWLVLAAAGVADNCREEAEDVNGCGIYPPPGYCILINWDYYDMGCCGAEKHQYLKKEWYDCEGYGAATCEYRLWYWEVDHECE